MIGKLVAMFSRKRKPIPQIGIGLDEPIEVSPGVFKTARSMTPNAKSPQEFDEQLRLDVLNNPELAIALEQGFGWKNGKPSGKPVINQIIDNALAESEAYINTATGREPFKASYQEGKSSAVKLAISEHSTLVLAPSQAIQNKALLDEFVAAKDKDDQLTMAKIYCVLRDFDYGY